MDEVLREALCIPEPDAVFGPPRESWEYIDGELVVRGQGVPTPRAAAAAGLPAPAPAAAVGDGSDGGLPAPTGNA
jgi:ATP-dependent Lon protease